VAFELKNDIFSPSLLFSSVLTAVSFSHQSGQHSEEAVPADYFSLLTLLQERRKKKIIYKLTLPLTGSYCHLLSHGERTHITA
jgi:hypothetical protein